LPTAAEKRAEARRKHAEAQRKFAARQRKRALYAPPEKPGPKYDAWYRKQPTAAVEYALLRMFRSKLIVIKDINQFLKYAAAFAKEHGAQETLDWLDRIEAGALNVLQSQRRERKSTAGTISEIIMKEGPQLRDDLCRVVSKKLRVEEKSVRRELDRELERGNLTFDGIRYSVHRHLREGERDIGGRDARRRKRRLPRR